MSEADSITHTDNPNVGKVPRTPGKARSEEIELSASGFVGMLSRRRVREPDPLGAPPPVTPRQAPPMPKPQPVAAQAVKQASVDVSAISSDATVTMNVPVVIGPAKAGPVAIQRPGRGAAAKERSHKWFNRLMPAYYVLGLLLLTTGVWAAVGVYSIKAHKVIIPLVNLDDPHIDAIAYALLAGLPLGAIVMIATRVKQVRIRAA